MPSHTIHRPNTKRKRKNALLRERERERERKAKTWSTRSICKSHEHTRSHMPNITRHLQFNIITTTHFFDNHMEIKFFLYKFN